MENKDLISNLSNAQVKEMSKVLAPILNSLNVQFKEISKVESFIPEFIFKSIDLDVNLIVNAINNVIGISEEEYKKKIASLSSISGFHKFFKQYEELSKNIPQLNYKKVFSDSIDKVFLKLEEDENVNLKDIDKNEIEEFKNDLYEINKENVVLLNRQQKLFDVYKKWAYKNPIIAAILIFLFTTIVGFYLTILLPVRKNANSNSQIINQTTINNITIIGDVKYYYKVQTRDNKGNIINGYVAKRKYNKLKSNKTVEK